TYGRIELSGVGIDYLFDQLIDATDTEISIVHSAAAFPSLINVTNGAISLQRQAMIEAPLLASIDGASFFAIDGSVLNLPAATSYSQATNAANLHQYWRVSGAGSRLNLPSLTTIEGGNAYNTRLFIESLTG